MDVFQQSRLTFLEIAEYYLIRTPEFLVVVLPVALLLALLYTLSNHARHQELVAIRSAGVSLWRLAIPYLATGLALSLALFYANENWACQSADQASEILIRHQIQTDGMSGHQWKSPMHFRNDRDRRIWNIASYNIKTGEMMRPQVEWQLPDGSRKHWIAERAELGSSGWIFTNVTIMEFPAGEDSLPMQSQTNQLIMAEFEESPELIKSEIKINELTNVRASKKPQLSLRELNNYWRLHRDMPLAKEILLRTQFHGRIAEPWTCLVVVLMALPFGAASARRNVFAGMAASIFICFSYFVLMKLGLALGTAGYLHPWLAAWLPNLCFGGTGIWLTHRAQ
jgi:lipopolysaccharide export system permease protein